MSEKQELLLSSTSLSTSKEGQVPFEVLSRPSDVIKTLHKTIIVANVTYELILVTMKRSFLLVVDNLQVDSGEFPVRLPQMGGGQEGGRIMSEDTLIRSFMNDNSRLKGLSLAIGGHSTCLIASENSLASLTLASRLSKTLNENGPVYVASNIQAHEDIMDPMDNMASLYEKVFQFVRQNHSVSNTAITKVDASS